MSAPVKIALGHEEDDGEGCRGNLSPLVNLQFKRMDVKSASSLTYIGDQYEHVVEAESI